MSVDQRAFTAALLDPEAAIPPGLIDPEGRPAGKRFNVYRNNVIVSLMDAMEDAFPVITKLIGPQNFRNLARIFVRQHPPTTPMLMFYGEEFPSFLKDFEPLSHLAYLPDVARLECARRQVYHAADTAPVAGDALAGLAPDALMEARLGLSPALALVNSPWPVASIWHFNMTDGAPQPPGVAETALIARPALDLEMEVVDAGTAAFLQALDHQTLGEAYEAGVTTQAAFDLAGALAMMMRLGLIVDVTS